MSPAQTAARLCLRWYFDRNLVRPNAAGRHVWAWCDLICTAYPHARGDVMLACREIADWRPSSGLDEEDLAWSTNDLLNLCAELTDRDPQTVAEGIAA